MSDGDTSRVLHVDDDEPLVETAAVLLERLDSQLSVVTATTATEAWERLDEHAIDCIVSDYDLEETTGLDFLDEIREQYPDLPFILFTGKGSEEIASEAISRGVTDYLQKEAGKEQYTVLANRIENAVAQHRAEQEIEETRRWYRTILKHSSDYVMIVNQMGEVSYISPSVERVLGYTPEELMSVEAFEYVHPEDTDRAAETLGEVIANPKREVTVEFRSKHKDGSWRWLEVRGRNLLGDPTITGVMVNVRDITTRKKREQELRNEAERLQNVASFLSHDMRNQLSVLSGHITLLEDEIRNESTDAASGAIGRLEEMIDKIAQLAEGGTLSVDPVVVDLEPIARACWLNNAGHESELHVESSFAITADESQLHSLLENLFLNAIEHGDAGTVRIGKTDGDGFYVADDGSGISDEERAHLFDAGYTTSEEGTGLGLSIVKNIADTHGWSIDVLENDGGGVRFEFGGVSIT